MDDELAELIRDAENESRELQTEVAAIFALILAELARDEPRRGRLMALTRRLRAAGLAAEALVEGLGADVALWVDDGLVRLYEGAVDSVPGNVGMGGGHRAILGARQATVRDAMGPLVGTVAAASIQWARNMAFTLGRSRALPDVSTMRRAMRAHPIGRVRYQDGSMHEVGEYIAMVVDTNGALAVNEATIAESRRQGITVLQISDGPNCGLGSHKGSPKADGLLVPVEVAQTYALAHPRCHRSFTPRPDVTTL